MSVIGIDLGNQNCTIAQAKRGGTDIILNESSSRQTPSVVSFQEQRFVGDQAAAKMRTNYKNTVSGLKRLIGCEFDDEEAQQEISHLPFDCVKTQNGTIGVKVTYNGEQMVLRLEHLMGILLSYLKSCADVANPGSPVVDVVIGIPAYFNDQQRRSMLDACRLANLNCLRLMHENTAVALSYGIYRSATFDQYQPHHVLFIDMGQSNYCVSVVAFVQSKLQVKSCVYDRNLGGRNFDQVIMDWIRAEFHKKTNLDAYSNIKAILKLEQAAEKAKKTLSPSGVTEASVSVECLMNDIDFNGNLSREIFEKGCQSLLDRLELPIQQALNEAGITREQLLDIEIVGGGTRVACVKNRLSDIFGLDKSKPNFGLSTTLNADESIAKGCALQSAMLSPRFRVKDFEVIDTIPFPVKLFWEPTEFVANELPNQDEQKSLERVISENQILLFERNDTSPKALQITLQRSTNFTLFAEYIASSYPPQGKNSRIAQFNVSGISSSVDEENTSPHNIYFECKHDLHGIFSISNIQMMKEISNEPSDSKQTDTQEVAKNKSSETKSDIEQNQDEQKQHKMKKQYRKLTLNIESLVPGLSKAQFNEIDQREKKMLNQDRIIREAAHKRNELEAYIYEMRDRIVGELNDFISENGREEFAQQLQNVEDWLEANGYHATKSMYQQKLNELIPLGERIIKRKNEFNSREAAIFDLKNYFEKIESFLNSSEEKYMHITSQERDKIRSALDKVKQWLLEQENHFNTIPLYADPVVTVAQIRERMSKLAKLFDQIIHKPKPTEKKNEEPQQQTKQSQSNDPTKEINKENEIQKDTSTETQQGSIEMDTSA